MSNGGLSSYFFKSIQRGLLLCKIGSLSLDQLIIVDFMSVEFRTIHAAEHRLASHGDPAGPAHSGGINHNGIQADHGLHPLPLRQFAQELHHRHRSDPHHQFHLILLIEDLLEDIRHETMMAVTSVIGRYP